MIISKKLNNNISILKKLLLILKYKNYLKYKNKSRNIIIINKKKVKNYFYLKKQ